MMNWGWLLAILGIAAGVGTAVALVSSGGSGSGGASPPPATAPATPTLPPSPPSPSPPAPPAPSTPLPTLGAPSVTTTAAGTTISWQDAGRGALGYTVDIDDDPSFPGGFWHKSVSAGTTTTSAPDGFVAYNGATGPLTLTAGTYGARIYYPATGEQSPVATFTVFKLTNAIGFTLGFAVHGQDPTWRQIPQYAPYDSNEPGWWDSTVDDAVRAGVDFVAPVTRGANPTPGGPDVGSGNPKNLDKLAASLARYPVNSKPKVALFVDCGGAFTITKNLNKHGSYSTSPPFDWADPSGAGEGGWSYFWDQDIALFYDTIPQDRLYLYDGRPLIYFWSVVSPLGYVNQQGNLSPFLRYVKQQVQARLGVEPFIVVDQSWVTTDTTVTPNEADGVDNWFDPSVSAYTVRNWNGMTFGVSCPGFIDNSGSSLQRNLPRNGGDTLRNALTAIRQAGANLTLLEGLTDVEESAGYYRSDDPAWLGDPNRYLDVVASFTTP